MPEVTRSDVIHEAIEKVKPTKDKANEQRKRLIEHTGAIISISIVVLSLALYSYNTGYCSVFRLPPECMPLNVTSYLPLAIQLCSLTIYILAYFSSLKTTQILNKIRIHYIRILYGWFIILTLFNSLRTLIGGLWFLFISLAIPIIVEILFVLKKTRQKDRNRKVTSIEYNIMLEDMIKNSIFNTYYMGYGLCLLALIVVLAPAFGKINAHALRKYQSFTYEKVQYVVIIDYSDRILAQRARIDQNTLYIDASEYCYLSEENIHFIYNTYDDVIIIDSTSGEANEMDSYIDENVPMISPEKTEVSILSPTPSSTTDNSLYVQESEAIKTDD